MQFTIMDLCLAATLIEIRQSSRKTSHKVISSRKTNIEKNRTKFKLLNVPIKLLFTHQPVSDMLENSCLEDQYTHNTSAHLMHLVITRQQ
jgi:hypothetical protein